MNATPFIKKFTVNNNKYIYCANTNRIMNVDSIIYDIIDYKYGEIPKEISNKYSVMDLKQALNELIAIEKDIGFAAKKRPENIKSSIAENEYRKKIYSNMKMISLCVTRECNMACIYCTYGKLNIDRRKDTPKFMSLRTAQKAIEMICNNSGKQDTVGVGFYGGEPLLNYDLIKGSVKYLYNLNNNGMRKTVNLFITSNGTLLNKNIITWMIDNNLNLLISIDGPENLHDRYRRFRNGKGTYQRIIEKLEMIKKIDKEYYYSKVKYNMVIAPPREYDQLSAYLVNNNLIPHKNVRIENVNYDDSGYLKKIEEASFKINNEHTKILEKYIKMANKGAIDELEKQKMSVLKMFEGIEIEQYVNRKFAHECCTTVMNPVCEPGVTRCFVLTDGSMYPCERVKEYKYLEFGNVHNGLYRDNEGRLIGYNMIKQFTEKLKTECINCWAYRFCAYKTCFRTASAENGFSRTYLMKNCDRIRRIIEKQLKYYMIFEKTYPNAMKNIFKASIDLATNQ